MKPALAIILGSFLGLTLGLGLYTFVYDIKAAKDAGASDAELAEARQWQRRAQFYVDFLVSEKSMGFHADQYSVKSLAEAINFCREGQLSLRKKLSVSRAAIGAPPRSSEQ